MVRSDENLPLPAVYRILLLVHSSWLAYTCTEQKPSETAKTNPATMGSDVSSAETACANADRTTFDTECTLQFTLMGEIDIHCTNLVHLLLSLHVASKVVCNQEPVIALGHVIDIVHQILEVLSLSKCAVSNPAGTHYSQDQVSDDLE